MVSYNSTKFQIDTTLLTTSKLNKTPYISDNRVFGGDNKNDQKWA